MSTKTNKHHPPLRPHYSIEEVAAAYGLHAETVRRWITRAGCPALSTGGSWRLDAVAVEGWLRERGHLRARRRGAEK